MTRLARHFRLTLVLSGVMVSGPYNAVAQEADLQTFASYRAAADALIVALKGKDEAQLKHILGPEAIDLLSSGDATQDDNARSAFLKRYAESHGFKREGRDAAILTVGNANWPLPFPIVRVDEKWHFDAAEGAQELVYRRIGSNELDAIKVCRALVAAQKAYAAASHDGKPKGTYAQRFRSEPGTENGLYWDVKEGAAESPAGELVAEAASEGYDAPAPGKRTPFHGYFYRILKSQGEHAPGGAKDYVLDGTMRGGFAIVAYPAEYRGSGVMTFLVSAGGVVYQKDLGADTEQTAQSLSTFDPDKTWTLAR